MTITTTTTNVYYLFIYLFIRMTKTKQKTNQGFKTTKKEPIWRSDSKLWNWNYLEWLSVWPVFGINPN